MTLTDDQKQTAEAMLRHLADIQTEFWDAALELEKFLDCEIDTNLDLETYSISELQALAEYNETNAANI